MIWVHPTPMDMCLFLLSFSRFGVEIVSETIATWHAQPEVLTELLNLTSPAEEMLFSNKKMNDQVGFWSNDRWGFLCTYIYVYLYIYIYFWYVNLYIYIYTQYTVYIYLDMWIFLDYIDCIDYIDYYINSLYRLEPWNDMYITGQPQVIPQWSSIQYLLGCNFSSLLFCISITTLHPIGWSSRGLRPCNLFWPSQSLVPSSSQKW